MTLRQALGGDAQVVHDLVDQLLDSEDALIVLVGGQRAVSFAGGFGLSPCQLELVSVDIERAVRKITAGQSTAKEKKRPEKQLGRAA